MRGLRTELRYPTQKRVDTIVGGVTNEQGVPWHSVEATYQAKKGVQQHRKAPMMRPSVFAALLSL